MNYLVAFKFQSFSAKCNSEIPVDTCAPSFTFKVSAYSIYIYTFVFVCQIVFKNNSRLHINAMIIILLMASVFTVFLSYNIQNTGTYNWTSSISWRSSGSIHAEQMHQYFQYLNTIVRMHRVGDNLYTITVWYMSLTLCIRANMFRKFGTTSMCFTRVCKIKSKQKCLDVCINKWMNNKSIKQKPHIISDDARRIRSFETNALVLVFCFLYFPLGHYDFYFISSMI